MENIPFTSSDDEEEKPSNMFEFSNEDDDEEDSKGSKSKKKATPKKSLFFAAEKSTENSEDIEEAPKSLFGDNKEGLFSSLLKPEEEHAESTAEVSTTEEVPIDTEEAPDVTEEFQEVVGDKLEAVVAEVENTPEDSNSELVADATFLSSVGERMASGVPPEEAIIEAADVTIDDLENASFGTEEMTPEVEEPESIEVEDEEDPVTPVVPAPIVPTPAGPVQQPSPNVQPLTPVNPFGGGPGGSGTGGGTGPNTPNMNTPNTQNFNAAPAAPNLSPNSPDVSKMNEFYYRDKKRGGLLLGGAIGYLFGRRRGRIKTEERLEPEIDKRDAEINKLEGELEQSEADVKKVAAEKLREEAKEALSAAPVVEKVQEIKKQEEDKSEKAQEQAVEEIEKLSTSEPEKISNIETAAVAMAKSIEKATVEGPKTPAERARDVKTMSTADLLEIADNISLESQTLRELYELRKIDADNMRRVIIEYLTGNNYDRLLRKSLETVDLEQKNSIESKQSKVDSDAADNHKPQNNVSTAVSPSLDVPLRPDQLQIVGTRNSVLNNDDNARNQGSNMTISYNTAIMLGIVTGLIIMAIIAFYSGSF